ncbi:MAG: FKBP-type peptidyl-prolyl cis-trans isomerase [Bacteroidales bacterium]
MNRIDIATSAFIAFILMIVIFLVSCSNHKNQTHDQNSSNPKETLLNINKNLVKTEDQQIEDFVARYNWKMKNSRTGLRYLIYEEGNGPSAKLNNIATIEYSVSLLSGDTCYSSAELGPKVFKIGKGVVESGLEEGILLLKVGDRAKFILPSRLAFGLIGDGDKIPARATLIYDVKLIELK